MSFIEVFLLSMLIGAAMGVPNLIVIWIQHRARMRDMQRDHQERMDAMARDHEARMRAIRGGR